MPNLPKLNLLGRLARVTNSQKFIAEVDGLRFVAIITVLLFHISKPFVKAAQEHGLNIAPEGSLLFWFIDRGGLGVDVFFTISGFILALPFARYHLGMGKKPELKKYFLRRITRLEPPYVLALVLFFVALVVVMNESATELLPHLLASIFYVHFFVYGDFSPILAVQWSLETEVQFYILAPLFARVFALKSKSLRRGIMVAVIVALPFITLELKPFIHQYHLGKSLLMYLHLFFVGFLVADIWLVEWQGKPRKQWGYDILGLLALLGLFVFIPHQEYLFRGFYDHQSTRIGFAIAAFALFVAVFRSRGFNWFFTRPLITVIGGMCYTIYLIHHPILYIVVGKTYNLGNPSSYWQGYLIQAALMVPVVLGLSALYYALVERPTMAKDWPQKLRQRLNGKKGKPNTQANQPQP